MCTDNLILYIIVVFVCHCWVYIQFHIVMEPTKLLWLQIGDNVNELSIVVSNSYLYQCLHQSRDSWNWMWTSRSRSWTSPWAWSSISSVSPHSQLSRIYIPWWIYILYWLTHDIVNSVFIWYSLFVTKPHFRKMFKQRSNWQDRGYPTLLRRAPC